MTFKPHAVIKHIKNVIVKIPLLQLHQIFSLQKIRITSDYFDVRNDIYKIKNL